MDFFPPNKRTEEYFKQVFLDKELNEIIKLHKAQASQEAKRELQQTLIDDINDEKAHHEITADIKEFAQRTNIPDHEIIVIVSPDLYFRTGSNTNAYDLLLDLVHYYVVGRMEQKRGARHRSSGPPFEGILHIIAILCINGSLRACIDFESAGILLWKHELHEGVPKDHLAILQDRSTIRGNNFALVQGGTLQ